MTKTLGLENDQRPEIMKLIYGISDKEIASAEQTLRTLGVARKYNITRSFIGGINKLDLELLPHASSNAPLSVQFYFAEDCKITGGPEHLLQWLELDDRLMKTEIAGGDNAE